MALRFQEMGTITCYSLWHEMLLVTVLPYRWFKLGTSGGSLFLGGFGFFWIACFLTHPDIVLSFGSWQPIPSFLTGYLQGCHRVKSCQCPWDALLWGWLLAQCDWGQYQGVAPGGGGEEEAGGGWSSSSWSRSSAWDCGGDHWPCMYSLCSVAMVE